MIQKVNMEIERVADGVLSVETGYLGRSKFAACYLVIDRGDVAVIETNTNYAVPKILEVINRLGLSRENVRQVILTHIHLDHAGGAGELMSACPNAHLYLHPRGIRHIINPEKLISSVKRVYGEEKYHTLYGDIRSVSANRVTALNQGDGLRLGNRLFRVLETPGHALHHLSFFDETSGSLFSGDAFGIGYPRYIHNGSRLIFPSTSPIQFNPQLSLKSYGDIAAVRAKRILLTHFGGLEDIADAFSQLRGWISRSVESAQKWYGKGRRDAALKRAIFDDLNRYCDKELKRIRGKGLTTDDREYLQLDFDLNAQGLAHYVQETNG